jgi:phytoene dehydrogenase-like protein
MSHDGYELRFAVNYLAPFLLTNLLMPVIRKNTPARIVNVASAGQNSIDFDDLMLSRNYDGVRAYRAVIMERETEITAMGLGKDGPAYRELMGSLVADWSLLEEPLFSQPSFPRHPLVFARFGLRALCSARGLAEKWFQGERARALFAGLAAHSMLPLEQSISAAFGLLLGITAHTIGWPFPRGGSQSIANALGRYLRSLGGEIFTSRRIESLDELPAARTILCDVTPRQLLSIAGSNLPETYRGRLARFKYGPAAYKVDYALAGPVPWRAAECSRAGTVHLGGTLAEISLAERSPWQGCHAEYPFVLLAQPSLFDPTRAPAGKHTVWAYCHVPNGSQFEMVERIERQIERFAPGFRELILARSVMTPSMLERHNPNLVGGDISGGANNLQQLLLRPTLSRYSTPIRGLYLCSSSTPPGGGVHGMCGYHAARVALKNS